MKATARQLILNFRWLPTIKVVVGFLLPNEQGPL